MFPTFLNQIKLVFGPFRQSNMDTLDSTLDFCPCRLARKETNVPLHKRSWEVTVLNIYIYCAFWLVSATETWARQWVAQRKVFPTTYQQLYLQSEKKNIYIGWLFFKVIFSGFILKESKRTQNNFTCFIFGNLSRLGSILFMTSFVYCYNLKI